MHSASAKVASAMCENRRKNDAASSTYSGRQRKSRMTESSKVDTGTELKRLAVILSDLGMGNATPFEDIVRYEDYEMQKVVS